MPTERRGHAPMRTASRAVAAGLVVLLAVLASARPASAHTDFESSNPADGETTDAPVDEIVITFTSAATETGEGFVVLDPQGLERPPDSVTVEEDRIFRLSFDPPLAGGAVGVRWSVRSSDTHSISGAFSFVVSAPAPTTTTPVAATTTAAATTTVPFDDDAEAAEAPTTVPPTTVAAPPDDSVEPDDASGASAGDETTATPVESPEPVTLEEFLAVDEQADGEGTARLGRIIGFTGVVFGLGVLAFASAVLVGSRREVGATLLAVRVLGAVIAVGAAVEYVGVTQLLDESVSSGWSTSAGFATVLRLVGGLALVVGIRSTIVSRRRPAALSADVATAPTGESVDLAPSGDVTERARWRPNVRSGAAAVAVVAILASFWFDGHTATKGFRPLHAAINTVHVGAGAVWVGGVAALAGVAWSRRRAGRPARFGELVVRFSSIATVALIAVAVAGSAMTMLIMDSFADLTDTDWGQLLLLKLGAVAIATAFGAYNHFRLRPAFDAAPDDPVLLVRARNTLTAEAIVLSFVVIVTAWLVVAAT